MDGGRSETTLDLERFRRELTDERTRLQAALDVVNHEGSLTEESGELSSGSGDHLGDHATDMFMRELDGGLEENAVHLLSEIDAALGRIEDGTYGVCTVCGGPIGEERLEAVPYATLCIEDKRKLERGVTEPARELQQVDVRVGSTANALQPISAAERSLAPGLAQWLALVVVATAAVAADQLTKQLVGRTLEVGDSVRILGPFSIHHVENSGIAFGFFASRTTVVIGVTALAVCWMLWFFARAGRRHPILPVGLGLVLGGSIANLIDRIRLGRVTDFLDFDAWPAFNLADTFIVVGVALLFGTLVLADRSGRMHGRPRDGEAALQRR